jgi:hypothetical protein
MRISAIIVLMAVGCVKCDEDPFRRWLHNLTIPLPTETLIDSNGLLFILEGGLCGNTTLGNIYSFQRALTYWLQLDDLGLECNIKMYLATKILGKTVPLIDNETLAAPITKSSVNAAITLVSGPGGFADQAIGNVTVDININPSFPGHKVESAIIALATAALKKSLDKTIDTVVTNLINNNLTATLQGINRQLRNITHQASKPAPLPLGQGMRACACNAAFTLTLYMYRPHQLANKSNRSTG